MKKNENRREFRCLRGIFERNSELINSGALTLGVLCNNNFTKSVNKNENCYKSIKPLSHKDCIVFYIVFLQMLPYLPYRKNTSTLYVPFTDLIQPNYYCNGNYSTLQKEQYRSCTGRVSAPSLYQKLIDKRNDINLSKNPDKPHPNILMLKTESNISQLLSFSISCLCLNKR